MERASLSFVVAEVLIAEVSVLDLKRSKRRVSFPLANGGRLRYYCVRAARAIHGTHI